MNENEKKYACSGGNGKRVKPKPPLREYKKSIGQRLYEWFTEVVE